MSAGAEAERWKRLRAGVIEAARHEPSRTRGQVSVQRRWVALSALLLPSLVFVVSGGVRAAPRPGALVLETALGSMLVAAVAASFALRRGRSMLGRPRSHLLAVVLFTPVALFAWKVLASARYAGALAQWPERPGLRCLLLSCLLTVGPLFGLLWSRRGSEPLHPRENAAALGVSVAAGAWVLVDFWCPVAYVPHLLLGHVLPVILGVASAVALGSRWLAPRYRSR
jgi:hypothetical protein